MEKTKKLDCGVLKYRYPNLLEVMDYMDAIGEDITKLGDEAYLQTKYFSLIGKLLRNMEPLVVKIDITYKKKKYTDFNGLMEVSVQIPALREAVLAMATDVFMQLVATEKED